MDYVELDPTWNGAVPDPPFNSPGADQIARNQRDTEGRESALAAYRLGAYDRMTVAQFRRLFPHGI